MRDLTADLGASAIPTLDHRSYVMKVFFPGVTEHPILKDPKASRVDCFANRKLFFSLLFLPKALKIRGSNQKGKNPIFSYSLFNFVIIMISECVLGFKSESARKLGLKYVSQSDSEGDELVENGQDDKSLSRQIFWDFLATCPSILSCVALRSVSVSLSFHLDILHHKLSSYTPHRCKLFEYGENEWTLQPGTGEQHEKVL